MEYSSFDYLYPSKRIVTYGNKGMVATSSQLAAQAGLDALKAGGNAIDAAVATAACLTVTEPVANGIGGDLFSLVWYQGKLYGLNASGPAPRSLHAEDVRAKGYKEMPIYGWIPVTVPGAPKGWAQLNKRFGKRSLSDNLQYAVSNARDGYAVSSVVSAAWQSAFTNYSAQLKGEAFKGWFETFAPKNKAPLPGEIFFLPDHADTLEAIGKTDAQDFYSGSIAERIDAFSKQTGGYIRQEDLSSYEAQWVDPVSIRYRGYDVWEIPPNGHGIVALMALNIVRRFEFKERDHIDTYHRQIEAMKLAYADAFAYIADPSHMNVRTQDLLSESYGQKRSLLIEDQAVVPRCGKPATSGTVYLATADGDGNMVSLIQSNYKGFGSGIVIPGTGIALHDRGSNFVLEENHLNCLASGKRPYHTIIPGFLTKDNLPVGPFGVMGGFMQPQGHMQVIMNTVDFMLNPQQALDAPRWRWTEGKKIEVEPGIPSRIAVQLAQKGHEVSVQKDPGGFGRGQIIWRTKEGSLCGGTEPRTDGAVVAW